MKGIAFDINAEFAYFRSPEGTRSSTSYPFPTRTAIVGLLASIIGEPRNLYWKKPEFQDVKIGIQVLKQGQTLGVKMNYWRTKTPLSLTRGFKLMLPYDVSGPKGRGFTTQVKYDYLHDVIYRIYVISEYQEFMESIENRIKNHKFVFPPYLGHANLLAQIEWYDSFEVEVIDKGSFVTIIPKSAISGEFDDLSNLGGFSIYTSVPLELGVAETVVDRKTKLTQITSLPAKYDSIIFADNPITIRVLKGYGYAADIHGAKVDLCVI